MDELITLKAICEIRYPAAALLFDQRGEIAHRWQRKFGLSDWTISRNQVQVFNADKSVFLKAGYKNAAAVMEHPFNYREFCDFAVEYFEHAQRLFQFTKLDRIGLRLLLGVERTDFESLVRIMMSRLYALDDQEWETLGGHPADIGFPLTLEIGDYRANFMMGPVQKTEIGRRFESESARASLPEVMVFIDFDLYQFSPDISPNRFRREMIDFISSGGERICSMTENFLLELGGFAGE